MKGLGWLFLMMGFPAMAEARPFTVVTFGTSLTAKGGWQEPLGHALSQCLKRPVKMWKIGGAGQTSDWGLANVGRVNALKPDIVIMEFAINDADLRRWMSPRTSRHNTVALIRRLREANPDGRVVLLTTHPVTGWKRLLRPMLGRYYEQYRQIARYRHIPLADGEKAWRALPEPVREPALPDGVHPDPQVFARAIIPAVRQALGCP